MAEYERLVTGCKSLDINAYMVDPAEAKKKFPLVDDKAFVAAVYCPSDGTIDPVMMVNALSKSAERNGCKVLPSITIFSHHTLLHRTNMIASICLGNIIKYHVDKIFDNL